MKGAFSLLTETFKGWMEAKAPRMGAALSYYTLFSITPLVVLIVSLTGLLDSEGRIEKAIFEQVSGLIGSDAGAMLSNMMSHARRPAEGILATVVAGATLLLGATGVFVQIQDSLNTIWNVKPRPEKGWFRFLRKRFLSFAMILVVGFLLLVSLVVSAALSTLGSYLGSRFEGMEILWHALHLGISFLVISFMFALIFKVLPDLKLRWRDVWVGAMVTSSLFVLGKFFLGLYLGKSSVVSGFGAAGGLVLILLWVYYSAQIMFLGAEFTQVYARRRRSFVEPEENPDMHPATV